MQLHITSQLFYSSTNGQNPSPRNPYIVKINGNCIKKGQQVNQLSTHEDMNVAAKPFSRQFASPVSLRKENVKVTLCQTLHKKQYKVKTMIQQTYFGLLQDEETRHKCY